MTVPILGGAPMKYTPEALETKIVEYFKWVDEENKTRKLGRFTGEKIKPYTLTGICVYLDISRETWNVYSKRSEFEAAIKRAKTIVENYVEEGLLNGAINPIGGIFNLKNNFGWVDKIEVNTNTTNEQLTPDDIQNRINVLKRKGDSEGEGE